MSQPLPSVRVELYDEQTAKIQPVAEKARAASDAGEPGMVLAQVFGDEMRVFFIGHAQALEFQRIMGAEVGRASKTAIVQ